MRIFKLTAEHVGRRFSFPRTLPELYGGRRFLASTEGGLKYLRPDIVDVDKVLIEGARKTVRPGNCVWDVVANIGLFTFAASGLAKSGGQVYAIEADIFLVGQLR